MSELSALFAARPLQALPLSPTEVLLLDHRSGERHVLTPEVVDALEACAPFASLSAHRDRVLESMPELRERAAAITPVLQGLVSRGLLESATAALQRLDQGSGPLPGLAPVCLLLPYAATAPPSAEAIAQLLLLARLCGGLQILCKDAEQARPWLDPVRSAGLAAECLDADEQGRWLATLATDSEDEAALFALAGPSDASDRRARQVNFAQLRASGHRLLVLDPDQLAAPRAMPALLPGLDLSAQVSRMVWFDLQLADELPEQAWASALDWCGRSTGQLLRDGGPFALAAGDVEGRSWAELTRLGEGSQVKALMFGSRGALDCPHNRWLYTLDPISRGRFWQQYGRQREGNAVLHGMTRARLLPGTAFAPSILAVDAAAGFEGPLGDTPHLLRGALSQMLDPTTRSLHLPWCLQRLDDRPVDRTAAGQTAHWPSINRLLAEWALTEQGRCLASEPLDRAHWWAEQLEDLARAPAMARRERLSAYTAQAQAQLINALQYQLENADGELAGWRDDAVAIIEAQARAILADRGPLLAGYGEDEAPEERFERELRISADWTRRWPLWLRRAGELRDLG